MDTIAAGLGSVICRGAAEIGFSTAYCYDWAHLERLGYGGLAVLLGLAIGAWQRFRSA
jgi:hypothetical protein